MSDDRELLEHAPGKINLTLLLGPTRAGDGRHELVTVMQSLTFGDDVGLSPLPATWPTQADAVLCPGVEGRNLALDALRAFRAATGWEASPRLVRITKRLPVAAGMGGGSADAAAVLRLAHRASGLGDEALLVELAAALGADVAGQVRPGRVLGLGAGERVTPITASEPLGVLVLPQAAPLSTADVYREADRLGLARTAEELVAFAQRDPAELPWVNDLEPATRSLYPQVDQALERAREAGADLAMVSGSGPTALGLFRGQDGPRRAWRAAAVTAGAVACEAVSPA